MTLYETQWALQNEQANELRRLNRRAWFVGASLLAMLVVELLAGWFLAAPLNALESGMNASVSGRLFYYAAYVGYYLLMIFLPVLVMSWIFRRPVRPGKEERRRLSAVQGLALVAFGLMFCILANYLVNYWLQFVSLFGIEPYEGDYHNEGGWLPLVLNLFTYALLPGVVEEMVFRGWMLGSLRPFGERRALLLSALIFALMHGNLTQIPFAFLLGLLFGFLMLRTGRLWPGMVIHALNNALSVGLDYARCNLSLSDNDYLVLQTVVFVVLAGLGAVAALVLRHRRSALTQPLCDHRSVVPAGLRARRMWLSPGILVSLIALLALTVMQEALL